MFTLLHATLSDWSLEASCLPQSTSIYLELCLPCSHLWIFHPLTRPRAILSCSAARICKEELIVVNVGSDSLSKRIRLREVLEITPIGRLCMDPETLDTTYIAAKFVHVFSIRRGIQSSSAIAIIKSDEAALGKSRRLMSSCVKAL